jgi:putative ABC transport system permease protein
VRHTGLDEERAPQFYLPEVQGHFADNAMALVVRAKGTIDPESLARPVQAAIHSIDASLPILRVAAMDDVISGTVRGRRFALVVFQVFAGMAVLLAALGMYGVLAGNVTERTREIGIRAALGASRGGLLGLVVRQAAVVSVAGIVLGTVGALGLSRFLRKLLFGIAPADPVTFAAIVIVLGFTALLACWIPARRATRVSPLEALRSE